VVEPTVTREHGGATLPPLSRRSHRPIRSSVLSAMTDRQLTTVVRDGRPAERWSPTRIGELVATYRNLRELRVSELARLVGVTPSLISQIERGNSRPSVATLFALAEALDVPVDVFADRNGSGDWRLVDAPAPPSVPSIEER